MVLQVLADAGQVVLHLDPDRGQVVRRANARQQQEPRTADGTGGDQYFAGRADDFAAAVSLNFDPNGAAVLQNDAAHLLL